jgi:membrane-associated phospholipid phosphatase
MTHFFRTLPKIFLRLYTRPFILWQVLAILLTYLIVISGLDWFYFISVRNEQLNHFFRPALFGGFLLPFILPLSLLITGILRRDKTISLYGWALGQAAFLGWFISSLYKAFTGRVQPNLVDIVTDSSRNFNFGFFEHGIFWGWPSSHTTVAFALAFAFITLLGKKHPSLRIAAYIYAFYVGIGVSLSIHWLSEFVAGAIIGTIIGISVGKEWKAFLSKD